MSSSPAGAALSSSVAPPRSIRLIGPPAVAVDGRPLVVDTRKAIALLAYVGTAARPVPRSELAALLWPESEDEPARAALRRTLSVLNAALGGTGLAITRSAVALDGAWEIDV
ncbi:MAG TPA: hypothetical protein VFR93_06895, partial [Candidatus Limnocylindrales bacterium]|nr:hypothetical protein [Candidatus Limnocylindrales bacterium]